ILVVNREIRNLIASGVSRGELEAVLGKPGADFVTLQQNAVQLALDGVTTVEEINRVINEAV
ncbi:MAG: type II secretion system protein GspE, partial [Lachnospiraceae bacterium]|nr:type II secretion system protein GspE [Lachnospiraceae bacterium]